MPNYYLRPEPKKPKGMEDWLTVTELAAFCNRAPSIIRRRARAAETRDKTKFPIARRIKRGQLSVRLYSPRMAEEAKAIFQSLPSRRNPPSKWGKGKRT